MGRACPHLSPARGGPNCPYQRYLTSVVVGDKPSPCSTNSCILSGSISPCPLLRVRCDVRQPDQTSLVGDVRRHHLVSNPALRPILRGAVSGCGRRSQSHRSRSVRLAWAVPAHGWLPLRPSAGRRRRKGTSQAARPGWAAASLDSRGGDRRKYEVVCRGVSS